MKGVLTMMYLTDRHEIAVAMNFGKYPVLTINLENNPFEGRRFAKGCRVRVAWDHKDRRYEGMTTHGELILDEDGKLKISGEGATLTASFGYSDVMKMAAEANVPVVHKGQGVVVVMDIPSTKTCMVRMMKVSPRIDIHSQVVCHLDDIADDEAAEIRKEFKRFLNR